MSSVTVSLVDPSPLPPGAEVHVSLADPAPPAPAPAAPVAPAPAAASSPVYVSMGLSSGRSVNQELKEETTKKVNTTFNELSLLVAAHLGVDEADLDLSVNIVTEVARYRVGNTGNYQLLNLHDLRDATNNPAPNCEEVAKKVAQLRVHIGRESNIPQNWSPSYQEGYVGNASGENLLRATPALQDKFQNHLEWFTKIDYSSIWQRRSNELPSGTTDAEKEERKALAIADMNTVTHYHKHLKTAVEEKQKNLKMILNFLKQQPRHQAEEIKKLTEALNELQRIEADLNNIDLYALYEVIAHASLEPDFHKDAAPHDPDTMLERLDKLSEEYKTDFKMIRVMKEPAKKGKREELEKEQARYEEQLKYADKLAILSVAREARLEKSPLRNPYVHEALAHFTVSPFVSLGIAPFLFDLAHAASAGESDEALNDRVKKLFAKVDKLAGGFGGPSDNLVKKEQHEEARKFYPAAVAPLAPSGSSSTASSSNGTHLSSPSHGKTAGATSSGVPTPIVPPVFDPRAAHSFALRSPVAFSPIAQRAPNSDDFSDDDDEPLLGSEMGEPSP